MCTKKLDTVIVNYCLCENKWFKLTQDVEVVSHVVLPMRVADSAGVVGGVRATAVPEQESPSWLHSYAAWGGSRTHLTT